MKRKHEQPPHERLKQSSQLPLVVMTGHLVPEYTRREREKQHTTHAAFCSRPLLLCCALDSRSSDALCSTLVPAVRLPARDAETHAARRAVVVDSEYLSDGQQRQEEQEGGRMD